MAYDTMAHCTEGVPRFSSLSFNFGLRRGRPAIGQPDDAAASGPETTPSDARGNKSFSVEVFLIRDATQAHVTLDRFTQTQWREKPMLRFWTSLALMCAAPLVYSASSYADSPVGSADEVIQWNKTLLTIVRTPGAQPATVHPTRSFAIMHAAVYDAVNAIDATHEPYLVRVEHVSRHASQEAAASAAAHETLIALYPAFQTTLDQQYEQSLTQIPDGADKTTGIDVGRAVALATLTLRSDDGSAATPILFVLGNAPGD